MKAWTSLLVLLLLTHQAFAGSTMAVLEYHQKKGWVAETQRFSDRLREEFLRRFPGAVLTKGETEDLFFYHKDSVGERAKFFSRPLLEEGKKNYFDLKLPEAERIFREMVEKGGEEGQVDATLLLGLTQYAKGDEEAAALSFREALRLDPTVSLDPQFFPPKVIRFFQQVSRKTVFPQGTLAIQAEPQGSEVWINGVFRGVVPMRVESFPSGRHIVRIRANHYRPVVKKINLTAEGEESIRANLNWQPKPKKAVPLGFSEGEIGGGEQLTPLAAAVGAEMGLSKVLFVSYREVDGKGQIETRLVDVTLRSSHRLQNYPAQEVEQRSAEIAQSVAHSVALQIGHDLAANPARYGENRFEGDIILIGEKRRPLYKKPLFWVMMGAAGAGGGITGALVTGGSASTGSVGIAFK